MAEKRTDVGKLTGMIGIICNVLLAGGKILVGNLANSMSVVADGLNNLSDAASSMVTLIGFKLAEKPADKEHPYGHARFEYLASLTISVMILFIGFELAKSSVEKIVNPVAVGFSAVTLVVLGISVVVKLWMTCFYGRMGKRIDSMTLKAAATDSRNDVIATSAVLVALLVEFYFEIRVDGIMGILVSLFILYSGISLAKETISPLIGEGANSQLREQITAFVNQYPMVLGCHDLLVHDYGPGKQFASIHIEMDKDIDNIESHQIIDTIEKECMGKFGTHLVVHYDPVITNDSELNEMKQLVMTIIKIKDERLEIHDFRMDSKKGTIYFDMVLPYELQGEEESLQRAIQEALNQINKESYQVNITYDLEMKD